jgi:hypothetical protein
MTTSVARTRRRPNKAPRSIYINASVLNVEQTANLVEFLKRDRNIEDVAISRLDVSAPPPPPSNPPPGKALTYFLTIEASAEPLILVVQFVQAHWDLVRGAGEAIPVVGAAYGGGNYLVRKIKEFIKNRTKNFDYTPLYDGAGNTIKFVKRDKPKNRAGDPGLTIPK